jgi:hypothetical protein
VLAQEHPEELYEDETKTSKLKNEVTNLSKDKDTVVVEHHEGEPKDGKDKAVKEELDCHLDIDYESLNISRLY